VQIKLSGTSYFVNWSYNTNNGKRQCICTIKKGTSNKESTPISTGNTTCSVKDQFSKNKGRKISMSRALAMFNRSEREQFWNEYNTKIGLVKM